MKKVDLVNLGLSERYIQEATMYKEGLFLGRVGVQHKDKYKVICEEGEVLSEVSGKFKTGNISQIDFPVVGDWVLIDRTSNKTGNAIIHHVLRRKTFFERKIAGTQKFSQGIAANIDTLFICMALNNDFNVRRLERYIGAAWDSMATPVIILTKKDLCNDVLEKLSQVEKIALGIDVVTTSSLSEEGYEGVMKYIEQGKTIGFIGSSGVGKSTLINKLIGVENQKTDGLRNDDKGRHTTTHRELIICEKGGVVIDTPGMRELGIISADLDKTFSDIEELSRKCKFSDCRHENEPRCAVREAIESGEIEQERLDNYKKLQKELKYNKLNSKSLEKEKLNTMFQEVGGMKNARKFQKQNPKRRF